MRRTTRLPLLKAAVKSAQSAGDNAWMLISAALVLMMTGPDWRLFYGGLVRKKERARHDDAELYPDGRDHRPLGGVAATAWPSAKARRSSATCAICS